jgi:hypothetical protein
MVVKQATAGMQGGDFDSVLTAQQCKELVESGLSFAIRYIPRTAALAAGNLTAAEIQIIMASGLSLGIVQHCPSPGFDPSAELGEIYGQFASDYCQSIGVPPHALIWLDLEGVSSAATAEDTIAYAQAWYAKVAEDNFIPALYVGYAPGIGPEALYKSLSFAHFWKAYNYDDGVATRGFQLIQHPQQSLNGIEFDPDIVQKDELGDLPMFLFNS